MTSRNYPPAGYSGSNSPPPHSGYSSSYEQSSGRPYYPATSSARVGHQPTQYYTPIAPAPPSDRYSSSSNYRPSTEYSSPSSYPASQYADNRGSGYQSDPPGSGSYPYNAPRAISPLNAPVSYHRTHQPRPFIPTPSEAYANPGRPPRPPSAMHHGSGSYSSPPHALPPPSARPLGSGSSRPRGTAPPPISSGSGERFICEVCGKDFSRAHDRKRHHETQHAATPITHKCIHCEKDFSRADSLKRHLQNGCDEAPQ
ncbi:hypothetical protein C8F04DRAFT_1197162 [Mycena alexandri]|uniref:C2H2-type domain-containing protein n=1 Tax=Mycena alexandri TaxID=1745969 RepID=A0AAD6WP67_9AGAR|nr:hypothetical protein C8F04DRAFT_1197162 [Mycena alexandri]